MQNLNVMGVLDQRQPREQFNNFVKMVKKAYHLVAKCLAIYFACVLASILLTILCKRPVQINFVRILQESGTNIVANDLWHFLKFFNGLNSYFAIVVACGLVSFVFFANFAEENARKENYSQNKSQDKHSERFFDVHNVVVSYKQHVKFLS